MSGLCVSPNKCECFEQYDGDNCTEKISLNLNTPTFQDNSYSATVSENRPKGFVVLTVLANDTDSGRSGEITYSIEELSIASFFIIDKDNGEISVAADGALDYESISQKQFNFTIAATDDGIPSRRSTASVAITVEDENDNCPVFKTVPGNYKLPVEIEASDDDHGDNGHIRYSITQESDPDRRFFISSNGILSASTVVEPGAYSLTIVAQDSSDDPCSRELTLTVIIDETVSSVVRPTSALVRMEPSSVTPSVKTSQRTSINATPSTIRLSSSTQAILPESSRHTGTSSSPNEKSSLQSLSLYEKPITSSVGLSSTRITSSAPKLTSSNKESYLQSSSLFQKPITSSIQPSSTQITSSAPKLTSSNEQSYLQSSSLFQKPITSSIQPSSTRITSSAPKLTSSVIEAVLSSSRHAITTMLTPSSSLQTKTTFVLRPTSSLQGETTALTSQSQNLGPSHRRDTIELRSTEKINTGISSPLQTTVITPFQPTVSVKSSVPVLSTKTAASNQIVPVRLRMLSIGFVESYLDKNSPGYKKLRRMVENDVENVFKRMTGYVRISDIDFEKGSVIANVQAEFSSENTQVTPSSLARAVGDATDEKGNLGDLHLDTSFIQDQVVPTTAPTVGATDGEDDSMDNNVIIGVAAAIGTAALVCVVLAVCLVSIK